VSSIDPPLQQLILPAVALIASSWDSNRNACRFLFTHYAMDAVILRIVAGFSAYSMGNSSVVGRSPVISLEVIDHNLRDFLVIIWNAFCQVATFSMYSFLLHKRLLRTFRYSGISRTSSISRHGSDLK
jgi:hypothetical protein